ncbi:ATPase-like, ATP-binding domain protein [Cordyceps fumosorosea ARSEF 2679]|uniref:ATPase-like, ATP-binding domain protein n=1 Tax=Cordyceps fumosorosea (strain ARSEF 2679) TaxID=1081104 RepID=A0A162MUA9_CORFA|nr:ATPase-like, ATP-binding domain protein [Cordyceps fumosorosea ARSEF 2679]OAA70549.1 ATPase-like, ATP-binding domain protein [Cordyceps fumosorosea ARSEF 2679]
MSSPRADRPDERLSDNAAARRHPHPQRQSRPLPLNQDAARASPDAAGRESATSPSVASDSYIGFPSAATEVSDLVFPIRSVVSVDKSSSRSDADEHASYNSYAGSVGTPVARSTRSRRGTLDTRPGSVPPSPAAMSPVGRGRPRASVELNSSAQTDGARITASTAPIELDITASEPGSDVESGALGRPGLQTEAEMSSALSEGQSSTDVPLFTTRFTHIDTEEGHAIITGKDGVLQQCEDEPIHTPGAVQSFGCLLAMHEETDGNFLVRYVSENSKRFLGYSPRSLFRLTNFLDIMTDDQQDNLLDHVDFIKDEDADPTMNGPEILSISIRHPKIGRAVKLWCAIHINAAHPDLIICEFELDDDVENPLRPRNELTPDVPTDTLESNPSEQAIQESTEILSKPLRILRSARKRRGEQGAMQVFDILSQVQEQLASAASLEVFLKILIGIVKELTGFHRIMIYQFDSNFNGKVVTELVDTSHTLDLYKGLHFPASDIPRQARELYKVNKVRLLYDRDQTASRIVCRSQQDLDVPLDMTHAYLRAMSPIHIKYLGNMEVRSSMSISINAFNELWGLIACHSYGDRGMRVSFPVRKLCRLVGETASRNIERLSYASRLQARKLINTSPTDKNPSGYIVASSDDLLKLFDADCGLLSIKDETKVLGVMEHSQEALALLEYLRMRKVTSVLASQDVKLDFPDLRYRPGFHFIAGFLYVPLSVGGNDFIVFFRKGQVKEVKWAGNPYEKNIRQGTAAYLEPRASFKVWNETVIGKCREWDEEQVETASVLCLVYGKFIEIWRQKEAAIQNTKLTRLLLANSAHEVRTPLNAIINYLEIALEGSLDSETRENLVRSHSASKSLIYVINDLLDLTKAEEGQNLIKDEVFDLGLCIQEATDPFKIDADRKGLSYEVFRHDGLPKFVHGDTRRVRQAVSNVTANAVKHTEKGSVTINIQLTELEEKQATIEFEVTDTGSGMTSRQLDALFRDLEQVSATMSNPGDSHSETESSHSSNALGLGLAVVGRIVRNMNGQLRLTSEVGKGSRFIIQLPFQLPDSELDSSRSEGSVGHAVRRVSQRDSKRPDGEITLVQRGLGSTVPTLREMSIGSASRRSGSQGSRGSHESGKSDADRLIDAIQTPLSGANKDFEFVSPKRHSKGSGSLPSSLSGQPAGRASPEEPRQGSLTSRPRSEVGSVLVKDSKTPIKAVKIPDEYGAQSQIPSSARPTEKLVLTGSQFGRARNNSIAQEIPLRALIAEDDPINLKILRKRLERVGHTVTHAVNGEDCAAIFKSSTAGVDVILMDMQMPIVDGLASTKMIRSMEKESEQEGHSDMATLNGRVPIIAVSASLVEKELQTYIDAGFDAWILKPIDFKRLSVLMGGIHDDEARNSSVYVPGQWESGGWFCSRSSAEAQSGS